RMGVVQQITSLYNDKIKPNIDGKQYPNAAAVADNIDTLKSLESRRQQATAGVAKCQSDIKNLDTVIPAVKNGQINSNVVLQGLRAIAGREAKEDKISQLRERVDDLIKETKEAKDEVSALKKAGKTPQDPEFKAAMKKLAQKTQELRAATQELGEFGAELNSDEERFIKSLEEGSLIQIITSILALLVGAKLPDGAYPSTEQLAKEARDAQAAATTDSASIQEPLYAPDLTM